jgi:hypothetical protein
MWHVSAVVGGDGREYMMEVEQAYAFRYLSAFLPSFRLKMHVFFLLTEFVPGE